LFQPITLVKRGNYLIEVITTGHTVGHNCRLKVSFPHTWLHNLTKPHLIARLIMVEVNLCFSRSTIVAWFFSQKHNKWVLCENKN